jgi:hypothetical protein
MRMMDNPAVSAPASETFVIEGVITELQVAKGRENLPAQIVPCYRADMAVTSLGEVLGGFHGQIAAEASVAMSDSEDTENFACLIDQQVMCGTFGGASKLPVGKKVKAVVSKKGDTLVARAILSEDTGLVWVSHAWGCKAERMANFKIALWCLCFTIVCQISYEIFLSVKPWMSKLEKPERRSGHGRRVIYKHGLLEQSHDERLG